MNEFLIERLTSDRFGEVAELERLCFSSPWSKKSLGILCTDKNVGILAVDKNSDKVVAYGGMLSVLDEGQITNIATHPDFRRMGLGEKIVLSLIEYCKENGLVFLSLEVRESNVAAIGLYEKLGFSSAGVRKNFYTAPVENAIVMIKNVGDFA